MPTLFAGSFHTRSQSGDAEKGQLGACECYDSAKDADDRWLAKFTEFYLAHAEVRLYKFTRSLKAPGFNL